MEKNETMHLTKGKPLTDWAKEPDVKDLKQDLEDTKPSQQATMAKIKRWNDLRNVTGSAAIKKVKGRSSVQPKLIRKQAEWRYSALSEPFLSSDKLYDVEPRTFEDTDAAEQNDLVLNYQMDTAIDKVSFIDEYVRSAIDEGTVIVRTGWKRISDTVKVQVPVFEYTEATDEQEINMITQAMELDTMDHNEFLNLPEELQASVEYYKENQIAASARIVGYEEIEEEEIKENGPTLHIMNPENVFIDPACEGDYRKAGFFIISYETSQAELKRDGRFKNLDQVNWGSESILAQPDHATSTPTDYDNKDTLRKKVVAYEYWGWSDINDDGILKPISATWIGDIMVRMEESPFPDEKPPFVVVNYLPVKREVMGEPDAEILEDNQAILGAVSRGMIDLLGRSANSQQGIAKGFLDVTNKRRFDSGQDYQFNPGTDPRMSVFQHTYPEIPNSALTMVQMQNNEAESITGVKSFSGGVSGEAYGDVAAGIRGALDASSKREMNILRRLASGIKEIGAKIVSMNQLFLSEKEVIRITNKEFVTIRREDLKGNFDLKVDISTPEIDEQKATDLGFMLQTIGPNMDLNMQKLILEKIAKLKRMPDLAQQIKMYEPQPDPIQEEIKKMEVEKLKAEIAKLNSEVALNQAKTEETEADAEATRVDAANEASGANHARAMEQTQAQAKANQALEVTKGILKPTKADEAKPDVESAIGYNALSGLMEGF